MRSLSVIVRWTYGQCPEHLRLTRCMSGSGVAAVRVHRTSMDANWTSTRQGTHEIRIKTHASAWLPYILRAPFSGGVRCKFWACTKLSAGLNGPCLIRSAFAEWETDIAEWETEKKSMLTETNGLKISFSVGRPLTLYGKVWQRLYTRRSSGYHRWRCNNTSPPFPVFRCPQGISKLHSRRPFLDFIFQPLLLSSSPSCSIHCFLQNCLHHARKSWDVAIPSEFPFLYHG